MAETLKQLNENMVRFYKISKVSFTKMYVNQHRRRVLMMSLSSKSQLVKIETTRSFGVFYFG